MTNGSGMHYHELATERTKAKAATPRLRKETDRAKPGETRLIAPAATKEARGS